MFLERLGTIYRDQGNNQAANDIFRQIVALGGDDNIERGYQQIIDTWREAKEWQKATRRREGSRPESCRTASI